MKRSRTMELPMMARAPRTMSAKASPHDNGQSFWISSESMLMCFHVVGRWAIRVHYTFNYERISSVEISPEQAREEIWLIVHTYVSWQVNQKTA